MKKILVLGSNGFIGQNIVLALRDLNRYEVICHVRKVIVTSKNTVNFSYDSQEFRNLLSKVSMVINCTGIGLSKLYCTNQTNRALTENICRVLLESNSDATIFHFSTIKAYNPMNYLDIYATDKAKSELLFKDFGLLNRTIIIRIPVITGANDLNFIPFLNLLKKFRLPVLNNAPPELNVISVTACAKYFIHLIENHNFFLGKIVYIMNCNSINWNDVIYKVGKPLCKVSITTMRLLWSILALRDCFARDRRMFPNERFNDLFIHNWIEEKNDNIINMTLRDDVISIIYRIIHDND